MLPTETSAKTNTPTVIEQPTSRRSDTRAWLQEHIDGRVAVAVGIAWLVLYEIALALEPRAQFELPLISVVLVLTMEALLITMVAGLALRRRWGLFAAVASSLLLTAESIACPLTGHHHFGTWWFGQIACVFALVGITVAALRRDYSEFNPDKA